MKPQSYAQAGVDTAAAARIKESIGRLAATTFTPAVLPAAGLFAGLFELQGFREPVLVTSADGVGTKLRVAAALDKYDTAGVDLVHHCVNDILALGARPLFLLDYIAMDKLQPAAVEAMVQGMAAACQGVGCALIGGETAEMPGTYREGQYDLVGFIVGAVEKPGLIDGSTIALGDQIIGLASTGLHTNGYSLVRRVFDLDRDPSPLNQFHPVLGRTLGEELLTSHRCYLRELEPWLPGIKGLAHITGGGLAGNLSRILPPGTAARIRKGSWTVPPIFALVQRAGTIAEEEMFRVFNMGIGMVAVLASQDAQGFLAAVPGSFAIGKIVSGDRQVIIE